MWTINTQRVFLTVQIDIEGQTNSLHGASEKFLVDKEMHVPVIQNDFDGQGQGHSYSIGIFGISWYMSRINLVTLD